MKLERIFCVDEVGTCCHKLTERVRAFYNVLLTTAT